MNFFIKLPLVAYKFNHQGAEIFNDFTAYVNVIEKLRSNIEFYTYETIMDGERHDNVSTRLYGRPDYHWTFYLMNNHLREGGWPLSSHHITQHAESVFPNRVITTETNIANIFLPGDRVEGLVSGITGRVVKRDLDKGQIFVSGTTSNFSDGEIVVGGETLSDQSQRTLTVLHQARESIAIRDYLDSDGNPVDIDPYDQSNTSALTPYTNLDFLRDHNENLKKIAVIKPDVISRVDGEFAKLMDL